MLSPEVLSDPASSCVYIADKIIVDQANEDAGCIDDPELADRRSSKNLAEIASVSASASASASSWKDERAFSDVTDDPTMLLPGRITPAASLQSACIGVEFSKQDVLMQIREELKQYMFEMKLELKLEVHKVSSMIAEMQNYVQDLQGDGHVTLQTLRQEVLSNRKGILDTMANYKSGGEEANKAIQQDLLSLQRLLEATQPNSSLSRSISSPGQPAKDASSMTLLSPEKTVQRHRHSAPTLPGMASTRPQDGAMAVETILPSAGTRSPSLPLSARARPRSCYAHTEVHQKTSTSPLTRSVPRVTVPPRIHSRPGSARASLGRGRGEDSSMLAQSSWPSFSSPLLGMMHSIPQQRHYSIDQHGKVLQPS